MWANKYIYRFPRQWIYFRHTGLHSTLFLKIQKFGKDSDHCCILQAFRVFSTDRISQVQNERLIMDMATCANGKGGSIVDDKAFKEPHGGRQHEMEGIQERYSLRTPVAFKHKNETSQLVICSLWVSGDIPLGGSICSVQTWGCIDLILPSNAHEIAENRLFVSVTSTKNGKNHLLSNFASREDLVKALLASSFIPLYAGFSAVDYKGQKWVDGGLTNGLPILPCGRTVTVSPFCGRFDICPQEKGHMDIYAKVANQDIMLSTANFKRFQQALFPPSQEKMELLYQDGYEHTINFLLKENWFE
ncbi:patatin-like phospholipase domain-containing protein 4 isoform X2 [Varanus komodoensis]|uniref:patatin-like phospholipase domain-containing protein 4 isoform X2 n=1 Tax=Varanus komodoensis TaxID=61221 RepID=UPI001CF78818|nr:patatin-like phospholipase domain-containing protein 4 isoform X2 [Varanus komodoensis]